MKYVQRGDSRVYDSHVMSAVDGNQKATGEPHLENWSAAGGAHPHLRLMLKAMHNEVD